MPQDPRLVKAVDELISAGDSDEDISLFIKQFKAKYPEKPGEGLRELGTGIKQGSEAILTAGTPWEQIGGAIKDVAGNVRAGHGAEMNRAANKGFFTDVANATGLSTMWQGAQAIPDVYRHQAPKWAGGMGDKDVAEASKRGQSEGVAQAFKDVGSAVSGDPTRKDETYSRKIGRVGSMVGMLVAGSKVGGPKAGVKKPYVDLTPDVNPGFGGMLSPDTPSGLAGPIQGPVAPPRGPAPKPALPPVNSHAPVTNPGFGSAVDGPAVPVTPLGPASGVVPQGAQPALPQPGRFKLPEVKNPALALEAAEANDLLKANPMIPQPVTDDLVKARMGERRVTQGDSPTSVERREGPRRLADQTPEEIIKNNPPVRGETGEYKDFGKDELTHAGPGQPGLQTETLREGFEQQITYRSADGRPIATARVVMTPEGPQVFSIASDPSAGLGVGRAVVKVAEAVKKLEPVGIVGGLSPEAASLVERLGVISRKADPSSHGPDATFHNNQSYDLKYSTDAQNAASKSKGRAMRAHAAKKADQADAPPQGMKTNPAARPNMLTDAEIDASKLSDETFIEKGPGAAEDAVSERNYRRRIADERGAVNPKLAIPLGAAVTGGVIGSVVDEDNPLRGALAGGGAGLGMGWLGPQVLTHAKKAGVGAAIADAQRGAMLAGPAIIKAGLGAVGGVTSELAERSLSQSPVNTIKDLGKVIKSIPVGLKRAGRAFFKGEDEAQQATRHLAPVGPLAKGPIRLMSATDAPAREALKSLGLTDDTALSRVLSGAPKSDAGKDFMGLLKKHHWIKNTFAPVGANTSVNVIEQGLQRLPGTSFMKNVKAMDPTATTGRRAARTVLGGGAVLSGMVADNNLSDKWSGNLAKGLINASMGPYAFPFAIGAAASRGKGLTGKVDEMLLGAQREIPLRPTAILSGKPIKEIGKRFTPSVLRQFQMAQAEESKPAKAKSAPAQKLTMKKLTPKKLTLKKFAE